MFLSSILCLYMIPAYGLINNFRFKHSNVVKGDTLPFFLKLSGSYYVDIKGTPELFFLQNKTDLLTATVLKGGVAPPLICTGEIGNMLAGINSFHANKFKNKIDTLRTLMKNPKTNTSELVSIIKNWGYYVDVTPIDYLCSPMKSLTPSANGADNGWLFTVDLTFNSYKTITFIDALGIGVFSYKPSPERKSTPHERSGNPVRFCGGVEYTGDMYTVEPRPSCPTSTHPNTRRYGRALITVYKPNIISVKRNVTRCIQHVTHIHAYKNLLGGSVDAWRRSKIVETKIADCKEWAATKDACATITAAAFRENDDIKADYYRTHRGECQFVAQFSDNIAAKEYKTTPDLKYHFTLGSVESRDMRGALLTMGEMEVSMPSKTMSTPWVTIPKERANIGDYQINNVTLFWEPFTPNELCPYTPRFQGEVQYIKYKKEDVSSYPSRHLPEDGYTLFLVAEDYGVMFNADSTQKVKDLNKLQCMPHIWGPATTVYQSSADQVIVVTVVDDGSSGSLHKSHIPDDLRHQGAINIQPHGVMSKIHYNSHTNSVVHMEDNFPKRSITYPPNNTDHYDLKQRFTTSQKGATDSGYFTDPTTIPKKVTVKEVQNISTSNPGAAWVTQTDALAYALFKLEEKERYNLNVRVMETCLRRQIEWDIYVQMIDINPSRAISLRLNVAVQASMGGNGYYNVKKCELAYGVEVIPTLRTNSLETVVINNKQFTVADIITAMGVTPDPEKCISMPLVIFKSGITGEQVIGQLTLEGIIRTDKVSYIEACVKHKAYVFLIEQYGHFFYNYKRNFTEHIDVIHNATERFLESSFPFDAPQYNPADIKEQVLWDRYKKHTLSKIHTLRIVEPDDINEKQYQHYPTGLYSNNLYSVAEFQSVSLGLMNLMEQQNFERFAIKEFTKEWGQDLGSTDSGFFADAGSFLEGTGDFFLKLGEGGGALAAGIGSGVGQTLKGAGEGIGKAGKGIFDGIGDALKSTLMGLVLPLVAVAVLAIVGVIIYKQVTGKDKPPPYSPKSNYEENVVYPKKEEENPTYTPRQRKKNKM